MCPPLHVRVNIFVAVFKFWVCNSFPAPLTNFTKSYNTNYSYFLKTDENASIDTYASAIARGLSLFSVHVQFTLHPIMTLHIMRAIYKSPVGNFNRVIVLEIVRYLEGIILKQNIFVTFIIVVRLKKVVRKLKVV